MNEEFKDQVVEETNENTVEQPVEEVVEGEELIDTTETEQVEEKPELYTKEQVDKMVDDLLAKKLARKEKKIRREFEQQASSQEKLVNVLASGMGTQDVNELTNKITETFKEQGVNVSSSELNQKQRMILARAEAREIVDSCDDLSELEEEANKLASKGIENMTIEEKEVFKLVAESARETKQKKELAQLGIKEEFLNNEDFKNFSSKFKNDIPLKEVYEMYSINKPKPKVETIGSMKTTPTTSQVKDFYTYEESLQYTRKDFEKSPELYKAIEKSMSKW